MLLGVQVKIRSGLLLKYRVDNGLTQKEAAARCDMKHGAWCTIETMNFRGISWNQINKVAELLDVSPEEICPEELRDKSLRLKITYFKEMEAKKLYAERRLLEMEPPAAFREIASDDMAKILDARIKSDLTEREQTVLRLRYGLDGATATTLKKIGLEIGLTLSRVKQIQCNALHKLRESSELKTESESE